MAALGRHEIGVSPDHPAITHVLGQSGVEWKKESVVPVPTHAIPYASKYDEHSDSTSIYSDQSEILEVAAQGEEEGVAQLDRVALAHLNFGLDFNGLPIRTDLINDNEIEAGAFTPVLTTECTFAEREHTVLWDYYGGTSCMDINAIAGDTVMVVAEEYQVRELGPLGGGTGNRYFRLPQKWALGRWVSSNSARPFESNFGLIPENYIVSTSFYEANRDLFVSPSWFIGIAGIEQAHRYLCEDLSALSPGLFCVFSPQWLNLCPDDPRPFLLMVVSKKDSETIGATYNVFRENASIEHNLGESFRKFLAEKAKLLREEMPSKEDRASGAGSAEPHAQEASEHTPRSKEPEGNEGGETKTKEDTKEGKDDTQEVGETQATGKTKEKTKETTVDDPRRKRDVKVKTRDVSKESRDATKTKDQTRTREQTKDARTTQNDDEKTNKTIDQTQRSASIRKAAKSASLRNANAGGRTKRSKSTFSSREGSRHSTRRSGDKLPPGVMQEKLKRGPGERTRLSNTLRKRSTAGRDPSPGSGDSRTSTEGMGRSPVRERLSAGKDATKPAVAKEAPVDEDTKLTDQLLADYLKIVDTMDLQMIDSLTRPFTVKCYTIRRNSLGHYLLFDAKYSTIYDLVYDLANRDSQLPARLVYGKMTQTMESRVLCTIPPPNIPRRDHHAMPMRCEQWAAKHYDQVTEPSILSSVVQYISRSLFDPVKKLHKKYAQTAKVPQDAINVAIGLVQQYDRKDPKDKAEKKEDDKAKEKKDKEKEKSVETSKTSKGGNKSMMAALKPAADFPLDDCVMLPQSHALIDPACLEYNQNEPLGQGAFGAVYKGMLYPMGANEKPDKDGKSSEVAIKVQTLVRPEKDNRMQWISEIEMLANLSHPNVAQMFGFCMSSDNASVVIVFELLNGSLDSFLKKIDYQLAINEQLEFLAQIARGMAYLHAMEPPIVHGDLAARNVLIKPHAVDLSRYVLKVTDFGISKITQNHENCAHYEDPHKIPYKWLPPEVLLRREMSPKADVWAYGVTTQELYGIGEPYGMMGAEKVLPFCKDGHRMERVRMPHFIYAIVLECWRTNTVDRPSFEEIETKLMSYMIECESDYVKLVCERERKLREEMPKNATATGATATAQP